MKRKAEKQTSSPELQTKDFAEVFQFDEKWPDVNNTLYLHRPTCEFYLDGAVGLTKVTVPEAVEWYCKCEAFASGSFRGNLVPLLRAVLKPENKPSDTQRAEPKKDVKDSWRQMSCEIHDLYSLTVVLRCALSGLTEDGGSAEESVPMAPVSALLDFAGELQKHSGRLREELLTFEDNCPLELFKQLMHTH